MAVVLELAADAPLRCRFAVCALNETGEALRLLARPGGDAYHLAWQRRVRPSLAGSGLGPLLAVFATSYQPDFLSPPPSGPFSKFSSSLARVRATDPAQADSELHRWRLSRGAGAALLTHPELGGDAVATRDLLADLLEGAWKLLVEPWWPQLRDVLDADIAYRARQMAEAGTAAVLSELHPRISLRDGTLRLPLSRRGTRRVTSEGLLLRPSVFSWPKTGAVLDPPWQPTLIYPARGIGRLWERATDVDGGPLARLIGTTRATILAALSVPASTTGLAARCRLPTSTVSEHLTALRACELITTVRTGRYLIHQQTVLGTALAANSATVG